MHRDASEEEEETGATDCEDSHFVSVAPEDEDEDEDENPSSENVDAENRSEGDFENATRSSRNDSQENDQSL